MWHACTHTNTQLHTTTHRGGSLELATITVCIVAYSLRLTGHTTSALLLSPVHCLLHHPPSQPTHTYTQCVCVGSGCPLMQGLRKLHRVSVCLFAPHTYYAKTFLESQRISCRTCSFCFQRYSVTYINYSLTAGQKLLLLFTVNI